MKALTVQQPWAWAIIHGGKDVENRTAAWKYRGPLAIHAGLRWSDRGAESPLVVCAAEGQVTTYHSGGLPYVDEADFQFGRIIGVVDLVDVHVAEPEILTQTGPTSHVGSAACCESPWAEQQYVEHGGRVRRQITHLVLANARPVVPFRWLGKLGLWEFPDELIEELP